MITQFKDYLQILLQLAAIVVYIYTLYRFTRKPHDTLEEKHTALEKRVDEHDVKIKEIKNSLKQGNDRFRDHEDTNEVMQICMLAIIDFELSFCAQTNYANTEDLKKAKELLRKHLARKREI